MERVIAEARRNNQPAYIDVPLDYALILVMPADAKLLVLQSNAAAQQKADSSHWRAPESCKVRGGTSCLHDFAAWIAEAGTEGHRSAGLPFYHNVDGKVRHRRRHPICRHVYRCGGGSENASDCEGADLVLDPGGVNLNDITTASYSANSIRPALSPMDSTMSGSETKSLPRS
jgi:indolepyruvate decarboxylase